MEQGDGLLALGDKLEQFALPSLQATNLIFQFGTRHPVQNGLNSLVQFALDPVELFAPVYDVRIPLYTKPVHLARELVAERLEQFWLHQVAAKAIEHGSLQRIAPNVEAIIASALVPSRRAAEQILRDHREATTTASALHEPREEVLGTSSVVERVLARRRWHIRQRLLTSLGPVPRLLIDDAECRHVLHYPLGLRVEARHAFPVSGSFR